MTSKCFVLSSFKVNYSFIFYLIKIHTFNYHLFFILDVWLVSVYALESTGNGNDDNETIMKAVIIPQKGEVSMRSFDKMLIKTWKDLRIGSILHLQNIYGILVFLDEKCNSFDLCYSLSEGRVQLRCFHIDLMKNKESIWMYFSNHLKCHSPQKVIDRAFNRRMYDIPDDATAWEFCKCCVINPHEDDMR